MEKKNMQMEALVEREKQKKKQGYTAFSQAGREKCVCGGGSWWRDEGGLSSERETRVCTPTCHTQEVPQEVEGRGTVGKRK